MQQIGLWYIAADRPQPLQPSSIDLESHLHTWIERDPFLLETGLVIVGSEFPVDEGKGRLDLLALDPQGRWVVIELKRDLLTPDVFGQALYYAACIARLPYMQLAARVEAYLQTRAPAGPRLADLLAERDAGEDPQNTSREVRIYVVGTRRTPSLEAMAAYLANYEVPLSLVSYDVYATPTGERILTRELTAADLGAPAGAGAPASSLTLADLITLADESGVGAAFRVLLAAGQQHGFYPRLYKTSVMFAPPANRTLCLFTVWARPKQANLLRIWYGTQNFAAFYPITDEQVHAVLGDFGWRDMTLEQALAFAAGLDTLFASMSADPAQGATQDDAARGPSGLA